MRRLFFWVVFLVPSVTNAQEGLPPRAPLGLVWEVPLLNGKLYDSEVSALVETYEATGGHSIGTEQAWQGGH